MIRRPLLRMILPAAFLLAGCAIYDMPNASTGTGNPVVLALAPNPSAVAGPNDAITFTVTATSPDGSPLNYTWAATKGTLTATKGQTTSWYPKNSDGTTVTSGIATVQLLLSDASGGSTTSQVNLMVNSDGSAQVVGTPSAATPSPTPSPTPTATSSAAPTR